MNLFIKEREVPVAERSIGGELHRMFQKKRQSTPFVWGKNILLLNFFLHPQT